MNIVATQYDLKTKTFEIYVAGCSGNPHCTGCHNPSTWDFNQGYPCDDRFFESITKKIRGFSNIVKNIAVLGGEPNDNDPGDLERFLERLTTFGLPIWLYTRYNFEDLPAFEKQLCDYIKCGRYDATLKTNDNIQYGIKLATSNQRIYKRGVDY